MHEICLKTSLFKCTMNVTAQDFMKNILFNFTNVLCCTQHKKELAQHASLTCLALHAIATFLDNVCST